MIYQEQFMQISKEWCGFTGGQADTLRKAVGKKKIDLMKKVKPEFIKGAVEIGGATEEIAETFWAQLLEFANYCFNKSHAACYALIAYWTAYLKAHYPDAFMAALMTADMRWTDRLAIEIAECKRMGIKVLGPDINESYGDFGIVGGEKTIRFGLSGVKNMGKSLIEEIVIPERDKNGPFKSICDFAKRVDSTKFNKKSWEAAIKTGAFDRFGSRSDLLFNLEAIQAYGAKCQKDVGTGQTDLFGMMGEAGMVPEVEIKPAPTQFPEKEQLLWERDLMGLYLSAHPLDKYDTYFEEQTHPYSLITAENNNKLVTIGGIITNVRTILTKKGDKMAFVKMENKTDETEFIVFPSVFAEHGAKLEIDNVVRVQGKVNATDKDGNVTSDVKLLAEQIELVSDDTLENYKSTGTKLAAPVNAPNSGKRRYGKSSAERVYGSAPSNAPIEQPRVLKEPPKDPRKERLYLLVENPDDTETLTAIRRLADIYLGMQEVVLVIRDGEAKKPIRMPFKVDVCDELLAKLRDLLGEDKVKVK
jgi:DNA polymerase-3 subunit alpha